MTMNAPYFKNNGLNRILRAIAFVLFILIAIGGAAYFLQQKSVSPEDVPHLRSAFQERIRSSGPESAYAAFKKMYAKTDPNSRHNAAHIFGETLYDVSGADAVAACDADFDFGCFHGFFIRAITLEGPDAVERLDDACRSGRDLNITSCQHGIGHGILEYMGHDRLADALAVCTKTKITNPEAGCTSGVFMEYFTPFTVSPEGRFSFDARPMENADEPYGPCPSLADAFKPACYHELPRWWGQIYAHDIARIISLCEKTGTSAFRSACFGGFGEMIPSFAKYDAHTSAEWCDIVPAEDMRSQCLVHASWAMYLSAGDVKRAAEICSYLPESERSRCPS